MVLNKCAGCICCIIGSAVCYVVFLLVSFTMWICGNLGSSTLLWNSSPLFLSVVGICGWGLFCFYRCVNSGRKKYPRPAQVPLSYITVENNESHLKSIYESPYAECLDEACEIPAKIKAYVIKLVHETWIYNQRLGKDSIALNHTKLNVKQIIRINNKKLWNRYKEKQNTFQTSDNLSALLDRPICTTSVTSFNDETQNLLNFADYELRENEIHLFHGTKLRNITDIIENGFDLTKCKNGLYGKGFYFADCSEKADQYTDFSNQRRRTDLAMLVVRVSLGRVCLYDSEEHGNHINNKPGYNTLIAGATARFREFILFDADHCYPEFIVVYDRE